MIRDSRKDVGYFKKYLEYQNKRIGEFCKKAGTIRDDSQLGKLYLFISGFLRDKLYASYSGGTDISDLKLVYQEWLSACEKASNVCYSDLIDIASLCVLLVPGAESALKVSALIKKCGESDDLLRLFQSYLSNGERKIGEGIPKYIAYSGLKDALTSTDKTQQAESLRNYIINIWYSANNDSAWHDSHLSEQDIYVGYWCFVGAAIAKVIGLDADLFEGVEFYPSDLVKTR